MLCVRCINLKESGVAPVSPVALLDALLAAPLAVDIRGERSSRGVEGVHEFAQSRGQPMPGLAMNHKNTLNGRGWASSAPSGGDRPSMERSFEPGGLTWARELRGLHRNELAARVGRVGPVGQV